MTRTVYDYPQYWDLAFRSETRTEANFIEAACRKYGRPPVRHLLEPGCGGGRLVVELASRGYQVSGFDLSEEAVKYVRKRLRRRGLEADVFCADMRDFQVDRPVDAAFNTFNTFRHLTTEADARRHLELVASSVRAGGIFILGFHLLPPDADEEDEERWSARHGKTKVNTTLRVRSCDRERRIESLQFVLNVTTPSRKLRLESTFDYRIYRAHQAESLIRSVSEWELCDVYDFWYDIDEPLELNDEMGDTVFILRRRDTDLAR